MIIWYDHMLICMLIPYNHILATQHMIIWYDHMLIRTQHMIIEYDRIPCTYEIFFETIITSDINPVQFHLHTHPDH